MDICMYIYVYRDGHGGDDYDGDDDSGSDDDYVDGGSGDNADGDRRGYIYVCITMRALCKPASQHRCYHHDPDSTCARIALREIKKSRFFVPTQS